MKLYAPNRNTYWTGIVFALIGVLGEQFKIEWVSERATIFLYIGLLLLALGPWFKILENRKLK